MLNIAVTGTNNTTINSSINYNNTTIPNTTTGWQYYEVKIPLTGIAAGSLFTISVSNSNSIGVDDILFYPDVAEVSTNGYDPVTNYITAKTNTNGVSTYYKVDPYGRTNYVYDQDMNIISRTTYASSNNIQNLIGNSPNTVFNQIMPAFSCSPISNTVSFVNNTFATPCMLGQNFNWNFGDNTTGTSISNTSITHTYSTFGTYNVTLSVAGTNATTVSPVTINTIAAPISCTLTSGYQLIVTNPQFTPAWQSGYSIIYNINGLYNNIEGNIGGGTGIQTLNNITQNPNSNVLIAGGSTPIGLGSGETVTITAILVSSYTPPHYDTRGDVIAGSYVQVGQPLTMTLTLP